MATDLTEQQGAAVRFAVSKMRRHVWNPQDIEDALQDAAEGVLRARIDSGRSDAECWTYMVRRALGAALDARRKLDGRWRDEGSRPSRVDPEKAFEMLAAPDDPLLSCAVRQAMQAIEQLPPPLPLIAARLVEGHQPGEIAAELGVSPSRFSQHRLEITTYLKDHFTCNICPA